MRSRTSLRGAVARTGDIARGLDFWRRVELAFNDAIAEGVYPRSFGIRTYAVASEIDGLHGAAAGQRGRATSWAARRDHVYGAIGEIERYRDRLEGDTVRWADAARKLWDRGVDHPWQCREARITARKTCATEDVLAALRAYATGRPVSHGRTLRVTDCAVRRVAGAKGCQNPSRPGYY